MDIVDEVLELLKEDELKAEPKPYGRFYVEYNYTETGDAVFKVVDGTSKKLKAMGDYEGGQIVVEGDSIDELEQAITEAMGVDDYRIDNIDYRDTYQESKNEAYTEDEKEVRAEVIGDIERLHNLLKSFDTQGDSLYGLYSIYSGIEHLADSISRKAEHIQVVIDDQITAERNAKNS